MNVGSYPGENGEEKEKGHTISVTLAWRSDTVDTRPHGRKEDRKIRKPTIPEKVNIKNKQANKQKARDGVRKKNRVLERWRDPAKLHGYLVGIVLMGRNSGIQSAASH